MPTILKKTAAILNQNSDLIPKSNKNPDIFISLLETTFNDIYQCTRKSKNKER